MGQKIHPLQLRTRKPFLSQWHSKNQYASCLQYELHLRQGLQKILQKKTGPLFVKWSGLGLSIGLTKVKDQKSSLLHLPSNEYRLCQIPKDSSAHKKHSTELMDIQHKLFKESFPGPSNSKGQQHLYPLQAVHRTQGWWIQYFDTLHFHSSYQTAQTLVSACVSQIEDGKNTRSIFDQFLKGAQNCEWIQGIKIRIAGRIQGKEIARVQTKRWGILRLHTIRQEVDFAQGIAHTRAGIIGVQIWISLQQDRSF